MLYCEAKNYVIRLQQRESVSFETSKRSNLLEHAVWPCNTKSEGMGAGAHLCHGIQISMAAILVCHSALSIK